MRKLPKLNAATIQDPATRAALEDVTLALREMSAGFDRISKGYAPNSSNSSLTLRELPAATSVATDNGVEGGATAIVGAISLPNEAGDIADQAVPGGNIQGLYRISVYCVPTSTQAGQTLTIDCTWDDGTAPGVAFTIASGAATAGANIRGVTTAYVADGSEIRVSTTTSGGTPVSQSFYLVAEYLGSML